MKHLLSLDPGLATFGLALLDSAGTVIDAAAIATKPNPSTAPGDKTTANLTDRARRIREVWEWLTPWIREWGVPPAAIVAEAGVAARGPRGPGQAAMISLATGAALVSAIAADNALPLVWATPREWRRYYVPRPTTAPGERKRAAGVPQDAELYRAIGPSAAAAVRKHRTHHGGPRGLDVHAVDAVGLGRWALHSSSVVRRAMGLANGATL